MSQNLMADPDGDRPEQIGTHIFCLLTNRDWDQLSHFISEYYVLSQISDICRTLYGGFIYYWKAITYQEASSNEMQV